MRERGVTTGLPARTSEDLKISHEPFAENLVRKFGVTRDKHTRMSTALELEVSIPRGPDVGRGGVPFVGS